MQFKCAICGVEIKGWGNNPWPIVTDDLARCCDKCNSEKVIPARIKEIYGLDKEEDICKKYSIHTEVKEPECRS